MILNQLLSDFETDEKDFEADSWSLAVDNSFLQQHKMDVMKRQDVIYGERGRGTGTNRGSGGWGRGFQSPGPTGGWVEAGEVGAERGTRAVGWHGDGDTGTGWRCGDGDTELGGGHRGRVRDRDRAEVQG